MTRLGALTLESTGEPALDGILGGGIPSGSLTVVAGEPGSGKTIFTLQMLFHAARRGLKTLYCTTQSEPAVKLIKYMQLFSFFDTELLETQIQFLDLGDALRQGADHAVASLSERVEAVRPDFVAIDSFRAIDDQRELRRRPLVFDLATQLAAWGTTALLVGEYTRPEYASFAEFAIADGIIRFGSKDEELTSVRELEILKLRGANYVGGRHFFQITADGLSVYPRVRAPDEDAKAEVAHADRISMGVSGLDEMLAGGIPRTSSALVQGATGVGKTNLCLQFLLEGARRGERGVFFTFEETPDQLRAAAASLGHDLGRHEREGLIVLRYTSPVELSTDRFLHEARGFVEAHGAKRAVFDSLSSMALGVPSNRRFQELVYSIVKHMRHAGVTACMTIEAEQVIGAGLTAGHGVSFFADTLIQIRYVEIKGKIERALSVMKSRGTNHSAELRALTIGEGGLRVTPGRFDDLFGIFTGTPTPAK
ncbi:MAG TPA: ATPase domain-containing protein [Polyangia bacterium]|nr:ATPase domain-containing protein [Polyangia bacterium]